VVEADFDNMSDALNKLIKYSTLSLEGIQKAKEELKQKFLLAESLCNDILRELGAMGASPETIEKLLIHLYNMKEQVLGTIFLPIAGKIIERKKEAKKLWPNMKKQFKSEFTQGVFALKKMLFGKAQKQVTILLKLAMDFCNAMDKFVQKQDKKIEKQIKKLSREIDCKINKISTIAGTKFFIKEEKK
jgi:hypothetical protein